MVGYIWLSGLMCSFADGWGSRTLVRLRVVVAVAAFLDLLAFPKRDESENFSLEVSFITRDLLRLLLLEATFASDVSDGLYVFLDNPKDVASRRFPRGVKE